MITAIKSALKSALQQGLKLPHAYDPVPKQPSFRLLTAYISFVLATASVVALHIWDSLFVATCTAICFFVINMIFYMLKKLSSAKIDLDDKSIELSDNTEK